jgi:radical SAM superfamily enzyme YgiQ (UPF0313 family)
MKVVLIYPRMLDKKLIEEHYNVEYPLGILYLGTYLKKNNIDCEVIDMTWIDWEIFEKRLKDINPDIVGVYLATPLLNNGLKVIKKIKEILKNCIIVVGGPHATAMPHELIKMEEIDNVIVGEGEEALLHFIKDGYPRKMVISFPYIENLDSIPFPDRDLLEIKKYLMDFNAQSLMTGRGCPFNCLFCQPLGKKLFGMKIRRRTPENVIEEMNYLNKKYGTKEFYLQDDTFTYDKEWVKRFCELLMNYDYKWVCNTRVDMVDDEILSLMKKARCVTIHYGVESGSQKILNFARKGVTREQIINAFKLTHKHGIFANAFLMIGFPTETRNDLEETVDIVRRIHPDGIRISVTTAMVGSDLYEYCNVREINNIKNYDDYDYCNSKYPIKLDNLTENDLEEFKKKMFEAYKHGLIKNMKKYFVYFLLEDRYRIHHIKRFFIISMGIKQEYKGA